MLPRFIPNEMELKAFKNYERSGKSFEELADEDKFMWLVSKYKIALRFVLKKLP